MDAVNEITLRVEQVSGFDFRVRFDKEHYPELRMDEPAPLGADAAPNPARILAAAIGDCLAASFVFCLQRRKVAVTGLAARVTIALGRNEQKRLRIGRVDVALEPGSPIPEAELAACLETFEDFCVVTQSVRSGIEVNVSVAAPPAA